MISAVAVSDYLLSTQKMTDGPMLYWKTIVLRTSLCTAPGGTMSGSGPGGDGGTPGGGPGGDGGPPPGRG